MARGVIHPDEVFNAARRLSDPDSRRAYLDEACGADGDLRARLEVLLKAHEEAGSFLQSPVGDCRGAAADPVVTEGPGTVIGPYKLIEQIGEGGFGVVFMAEQTAPVRRTVALKVIKPGMDTRQVIARFEAERQALALMDHPNIAKVLDAGTTGTGRPFFVMELVRGIPITEYCDAHRLTPRARLELFVTVCHAVQHAHQKGIIHRDLKPSNVLVALHDDRPVAKVIDFGIAKATSGPLTDKTVFTAFAQMIGTPLYMSPEQASMSAIDVDTRSDVYSLGVLLYELLTGTTPFEQSRMKGAEFDEVRRIVREDEPQRPSTRLSTAATLPELAANRGTEPAKLTRLVRGELDWIVMKALEKDRSRRYETANRLAMDVQRHLADEPVSACPPSAGYRLRKLVRRHKRGVAATTLIAATLLVVAGSIGWMARDGAARRARTAEAVAGLLDRCEEALRAEEPDHAALALESAERRAADGGAEELDRRLAQCRADLKLLRELDAIDALSWTWTNERFTRAEAVAARLRDALAAYGVTPDEGRAGLAAERVSGSFIRDRLLAALDRWLAARDLVLGPSGRADVAESQAVDRGCLAGVRTVLRHVDPDPYRDAVRDAIAASDSSALAELVGRDDALTQPARFAAALGLLRDVPVERRRAVLASALRRRPGDLVLLMGLGDSYMRCADAVSQGLRWYQAAVAAHPRNVAAHHNLGVALVAGGDPDEAIDCFREAIRLDPTFARGHCSLGDRFAAKGDLKGAIAYFRDAIRHAPNFALAHHGLAGALGKSGELEGAIRHYEKAIELDPNLAAAHYGLANALVKNGNAQRAIRHYEKVIELNPDVPAAHYDLGNALAANGEADRAIVRYENAIRLNPNYAEAYVNLGVVLCKRGTPQEAIRNLKRAIEIDPGLQAAHCTLGSALWRTGALDAAIDSCETAIRLDPTDPMARVNLGGALKAKGELSRAIACFEDALLLDPNCVEAHGNLGNAFRDKGELDRAIDCFDRVLLLAPDDTRAHCARAQALGLKGDLDGAIAGYQDALRFDPDHAKARGSLDAVHAKKRALLALETRLPQVLAGEPATSTEQLELAELCVRFKKRYYDAAVLYGRAFAAQPDLAASPDGHRYNAAFAAVLAAGGQGVGVEGVGSSDKAGLREQALDWMRAELGALDDLSAGGPAAAERVRTSLQHWLDDDDLGGVRDARELAELPDEERERWTKLWNDVRELLARAAKN